MGGILALVFLFPKSSFEAVASSTVNASAVVTPPVPPDADIVDDFDFDKDANYWTGTNGLMEEFGENKSITNSFVTADAHAGRSLQLTYNLNTSSSWNGYFLTLNNLVAVTKNISGYQQLSFWVKGAVGGVEHLKIGLENNSSVAAGRYRASLYVNDYLDGGITNGWQKVTIPLGAFANLDSLTNVRTLTFVFERAYADVSGLSRTGAVLVDDIRFSAVSAGPLRVDHFGDKWGANALGGNIGDLTTATGATASSSMDLLTSDAFPYSFKSVYNVNFTAPRQDWSGHFFVFGGGDTGWVAEPINLSGYRTLQFSALAVVGGNPNKIKIEILSGVGQSAAYEVVGLTTTGWGSYSVTLASPSSGTIDKTSVKQMNIIYEKWRVDGAAGNRSGTVYFDKIQFVP